MIRPSDIATLPFQDWVDSFVKGFLVPNFRGFFHAVEVPVDQVMFWLNSFFAWIPMLVFALIMALIAWRCAGRGNAIFAFLALCFIDMIGLWGDTMATLAMIVTAVVFCVIIGIPLGILAAGSDRFLRILRPVLDIMQTIPSFVYLVPIVMLFGVGSVPGVIATIIFALPPIIRLTNLGIREVPGDLVEAADSFGSTRWQKLVEVQLPLAIRTIMAGLNQTLMLALSMTVIAALIGAGGLGLVVNTGLGRLDVGMATAGGVGIVILAIVLDRITQGLAEKRSVRAPHRSGRRCGRCSVPPRRDTRRRADGEGGPKLARPRNPPRPIRAGALARTRRKTKRHKTTGRKAMTKALALKSLAVAAAASMALALPTHAAPGNDMPGKGKTIRMARATWDTGWWQADIYKQLFEKLGYDVGRATTLKNPAFYQAVSQGDVDLWVNGWFPLHNTYKSTFENGARTVGYVAKGGALQGYLIDKKTAEKYDIKYLSDMKKPKIRKLFDTNGDGKANMVACPPGWGCEALIGYQMKAYGLKDDVDLIKAGYSASMADALGRFKNGKPIFFYTWTPNWTVGILKPGKDVVWLQVKETKLPKDQRNLKSAATVKDVKGCTGNPCKMGMPANDIRPVANSEFLKNNPAVETLLKEVRIPVKDIFAQNAKMNDGADKPKDLSKQAENWIRNHQDKVDKWLEDARQAAG